MAAAAAAAGGRSGGMPEGQAELYRSRMQQAFVLAYEAFEAGEVPIGMYVSRPAPSPRAAFFSLVALLSLFSLFFLTRLSLVSSLSLLILCVLPRFRVVLIL